MHTIQAWINRYPVLTIVLFGIVVRLIIVSFYGHVTIYPDSVGYIELAERLLSFDLVGYNGERTPGYPLLLCLTGIWPALSAAAQLCMGIASLVFIYKILMLLKVNRKVSLYLTIILSLYIPAIFFELAILTETLTTLCLIIIFYLFFELIIKDAGLKNYILLSILCLYVVVIKPFYIFLPFLLVLFLLINNLSFHTVKRSLFIILLPVLFFVGWSYLNKVNTGYFVSTTFYGVNVAQTCVSFAENTPDEYKQIGDIYAKYRDTESLNDKELAMTIWAAYPELEEKSGLTGPDLSDLLYKYGIATIKVNPGSYLKQVFISWKDFWKTTLYWEPDGTTIGRDGLYYICQAQRIVFQLVKLLFIILILFHIASYIRKRKLTPSLIISLVVLSASVLQALVIYGNNSRFSFPFEYLIFVSVYITVIDIRKEWDIKQKRRE